MPASRLTAVSMAERTFFPATLDRNTAVKKPTGTPMRIAPAVPYTLVRIKGRMPNLGSAAVEAHSLPNRNFTSPISLMAGMPEIIRYTVMSSTHPTVISPSRRKMPWTTFSNTLFFFISYLNGRKRQHRGTAAHIPYFTGTAPALLMIWLAASEVM